MIYKKIELPKLDYEFNELEPVLSEELVSIHYTKHHQNYVDTYNELIDQLDEAQSKSDINKILSLTLDIKFNIGCHISHSIYWKNLCPIKKGGGVLPKDSTLVKKVVEQWGSFENFKEYFISQIMKIQGSGWGNLVYNKTKKCLEYLQTKDKDYISFQNNYVFILCIDGWEHAWYLKYKSDKKKYFTEIWKIINWEDLEKRYQESQKIEIFHNIDKNKDYTNLNEVEVKLNTLQKNIKSINIQDRVMYILQLSNGRLVVAAGSVLYIYINKILLNFN